MISLFQMATAKVLQDSVTVRTTSDGCPAIASNGRNYKTPSGSSREIQVIGRNIKLWQNDDGTVSD